MNRARLDQKTSAIIVVVLVSLVVVVTGWTVVARMGGLATSGGTPGATATPGSSSSPLPPSGPPGRAVNLRADQHTVFLDRFVGRGLRGWQVTRDGRASVRRAGVRGRGGVGAVRITVPKGDPTARAFLAHTLARPRAGVVADGWFKVVSGGCDRNAVYSHGNVPFFRMFDASGRRLVSLFRINGHCGKRGEMWVEQGGHYYRTRGVISLKRWYHVTLQVSTGRPATNFVEVDLDGQRVYRTRAARVARAPIASVTTQNDVAGQVGDLVVDRVRIATFDPDTQAPPTCHGQHGPLPRVGSPGHVVTDDGFESGGVPLWTAVHHSTGGRVVVTGAAAHRGGCGLWISSVHRPGSAAQLVKNLPSGTSRVDASGWFRVTKAGRAHDVVPILTLRRRVFPVVSLVRGNHTGRLFLRTTTGPGQTVDRPLGGRIGLGEWHRVQVDVRLRGAHSGVQVRLDGKRLRGGSALTMPSRVATDAVLGTNHRGQQLTIDVDDMVITTRH